MNNDGNSTVIHLLSDVGVVNLTAPANFREIAAIAEGERKGFFAEEDNIQQFIIII